MLRLDAGRHLGFTRVVGHTLPIHPPYKVRLSMARR
jgi:hypothetical protein